MDKQTEIERKEIKAALYNIHFISVHSCFSALVFMFKQI